MKQGGESRALSPFFLFQPDLAGPQQQLRTRIPFGTSTLVEQSAVFGGFVRETPLSFVQVIAIF